MSLFQSNKMPQQLSQLEAVGTQSRHYAQQLWQSVLKEAFEQKGKLKDEMNESMEF